MNKRGATAFAIFVAVCALPFMALRYFNIIGGAFFVLIIPVSYSVVYLIRSLQSFFRKDYRNMLLSLLVALLFLSISVKIQFAYYNLAITASLCIAGIVYLVKNGIEKARATVLFLLICLQVIFISIPDNYFYSLFWRDKQWTPHISWSSYKKIPPSTDESAYDASTDTYISYKINNAYNYPQAIVMAAMNEDSSWTRYDSPVLLLHEQGHFNLEEIYARKITDSINSRYPLDPFEVWKIIDYLVNECEKQQDVYDEETSHNRNQEAQNAWNTKLEEALKIN